MLSPVNIDPVIPNPCIFAFVKAVTVHPYETIDGCFPKLLADAKSVSTAILAVVLHGVTFVDAPAANVLALFNVDVDAALL